MTDGNSVKSSMATQTYKVFRTRDHEISGWKIISRLINSRASNNVGMNGDVHSDLSTLAFKNGEQFEDLHNIIMRLQQEIILYGGTVYPTRFLFQYTKALSNTDKLKKIIAPKMTYIIKFLDNNEKSAVYTGGNIRGLYCYL